MEDYLNTDSCVLYLSIQPGVWNSMRWSQVATLLGRTYDNQNLQMKTVDHSYIYTISPAYTNKVINQNTIF